MTVLIYGATGWTGAQVARALIKRGLPCVISGRSEGKLDKLSQELGGVETRVAVVSDPYSMARACEGMRVVINCAGPFIETGRQVVAASVEARAHYLDVSGEESHMTETYRTAHAAAVRRGVAVCPAFAAKGALGDWGASLLATSDMRADGLEEVNVAYAHGLREYFRPSVASVLASAGQGFFRGVGWDARQYIVERRFPFPPPFGSGLALRVPACEDISIPRHVAVPKAYTWIALDPGGVINEPWARASLATLPVMPAISKILFSAWGRWHLRLYMMPPESDHRTDSFAVSVEVRSPAQTRRMGLVTYDAYSSTAEIIAVGVVRLLHGGPVTPGVVAPAQLCDANAALSELQRVGAVRLYG